MKTPSERELKGLTITGFDLRSFDDGNGRKAHDPVIHFDDGSRLVFVVHETEVGEYGIRPIRVKGGAT